MRIWSYTYSMVNLERGLDCLQSAFSLKTRLVLDLNQRDCKLRCCYIDETSKDGLLTLVVNSPETEWPIGQLHNC